MAAINVDKDTAQAVAKELIKVGVAFSFSVPADVTSRWACRIEVDGSRAELLRKIWSIVADRRMRQADYDTLLMREAQFPTVGKGGNA
jgi:hypothetical protein